MKTKVEETKEEFLQVQVVVSVELQYPMQHGKRKISFLDISIYDDTSISIIDNVLHIATNRAGVSEHFPMDKVVKWRIVSHLVPCFPKWKREFGSYKYEPYTYPERMGGYLGSYSKVSDECECLGFLDTEMQVTMIEDLEA